MQEKWSTMSKKTDEFQNIAEKRYIEMIENRDKIHAENLSFQSQLIKENNEFKDRTSEYMTQKGIEVQNMLLDRVNVNEAHVRDFEERLKLMEREVGTLSNRINQEYKDFANNRQRWKSDFAMATDKAVQNMDKIKNMLSGCESQNQVNTRAIKMMLDAQMIE